ncbi:MAG TPA: FG-GAP-like repeat-containing protein [bacterium]|nr:FG-GAP-like repeat-containing protein [bacterium]
MVARSKGGLRADFAPPQRNRPAGVRAAAALLSLLLFAPASAIAGWVDVTPAFMADPGFGRGIAWGDFDQDGAADLFVANAFGGPSRLFKNNGGTFVEVTTPPGLEAGNCFGASWADIDNDGDLDFLVTKVTAANRLYRNDGTTFTNASAGPFLESGSSFSSPWADIDQDGDLDVFITRNGADRLLRNDGVSFTDVTTATLADSGNGRGAVWGDYDQDGDCDLYVVNAMTPNRLYRNDGGSFVNVTAPPLDDGGDGRGAAWGDADNDGDLDLYLANFLAPNKYFRNDGAGLFVDATAGPLGDAANSQSVMWEDFDLDADLDLYIVNDGSANHLLRNDGGGVFSDITSGPEGESGPGIGGGAADFDEDGDVDLFFANSGTADKLLRNDVAPGRHWLQIDLEGSVSNRFGVGARVRVVCAAGSQAREVTAGSGYLSQSALTLTFGLDACTAADTVEVRWPSGIVQRMTNVAVDARMVVTEAAVSSAPSIPAAAPSFALQVAPNPSRGAVAIAIRSLAPHVARFFITDLSGRVVADLGARAIEDGFAHLTWDGRSSSRAPVSTGMYCAHAITPAGVKSARFLILRE